MQAVVAKDSKQKTRQVFNVSAALQLIFFLAAGLFFSYFSGMWVGLNSPTFCFSLL
jgi:hypothetical protein